MSEDVKKLFSDAGPYWADSTVFSDWAYGYRPHRQVTVDDGVPLHQSPDKYAVALAIAHMLIEKWMLDLRAEKVTSLVMDIVEAIP